jgi:thiol:disulfide interchange protein
VRLSRLFGTRTLFLSVLLLFLSSFSSSLLFANDASKSIEPVKAKLIAEGKTIQPGHPFWVGVQLQMAEGWDTYWQNPGDSGFATQVHWKLPDGFQAGPLLWPYPEKFVTDSLVAFGYTNTVLLMAEITPPSTLTAQQKIEIQAEVSWLACKESCVPGSAVLSIALPVTETAPIADSVSAPHFSKARKALPQKEEGLTVNNQADEFVLTFQPKSGASHAIDELFFVPEEAEVIDYLAPQNFSSKGEKIVLSLKKVHPDADLHLLKGVLLISEKGSVKRAIQVESKITAGTLQKTVDGVSSLSVALGFAFVGGLILNVMPCVLPVVALKIFSFVKMAHQRRMVIFQHGGVFSLGVMISFWLLSGALLVLRAYGEGIGWGFQLQEPIFVAILAALLFLLGLSLFGVFEMGTSLVSLGGKTPSSRASPLGSSFMSGVLATLVATPCTGPLLGPALGFAMTLPPVQAMAIFTAMGLGMAFPYLLFSAFPRLVRFLPKPGNWMVAFRQIMGFLMMGTVVWLVWVFGAQTDNMASFVLLSGLLVISVGAWIYGKWGALTRKKVTRVFASLLAAAIVLTGGGAPLIMAKQHREMTFPAAGERQVSGWEIYSPERVEQLRTAGRAVFVDFTAKWCLICQANKVILHSSDIQKAFQEKGIVTMTADWTRRDPVITEELEKLGRSGVPVYVLYPADKDQKPYILPQTLSAHVIREYLDKIQSPVISTYAH